MSETKQLVDFRRPLRSPEKAVEIINSGSLLEGSKQREATMDAGAFNEAWTNYSENDGPQPYLYQPALVEAAVDAKALQAVSGQASKAKEQPSNWDVDALGEWREGDRLLPARLHHSRDVRKLVTNKDALIEIEGVEYVLGILSVNSSKTGNYGAIIREGKRLAFENVDGVDRLVGRINNEVVIEHFEDDGWIVWNKNQEITWGTLNRNGSALTYDEVQDDSSNTEFTPLNDPIVGRDVSRQALIEAVRNSMDEGEPDKDGLTEWDRFCGRKSQNNSGENKTWTNAGTLCRLHPKVVFCFGFRAVQAGIPCFTRFAGTTLENSEEVLNFVIGQRLPLDLSENRWDLKRRFKVETTETEAPEVETTKTEVTV